MSENYDRSSIFGLPDSETLKSYRIWDAYFTASLSDPSGIVADIQRTMPTLEKGAIQRSCIFTHVGLGTAKPELDELVRKNDRLILEPFERWPNRLLGLIQLNANNVRGSLDAINRWLADGPMVGVYFPGGALGSLRCSHPNFDPLIERIAELKGLIMQHTWFDATSTDDSTSSTPTDLSELSRRFPEVSFVCAHAGGEWESGIRAIRSRPNILIETSGFDPTSGFVDMAHRELGAERIVFGSHLPSRSLGTELGKVLSAPMSDADRRLVLRENLRRLLRPILKRKGIPDVP